MCKYASWMNSAIVPFLDAVEKANTLIEQGIVLKDTQTQVFPLTNPAKRVKVPTTKQKSGTGDKGSKSKRKTKRPVS